MDGEFVFFLPALALIPVQLLRLAARKLRRQRFYRRRVFGAREVALFATLEEAAGLAFGRQARVLPQVSLDIFLACANRHRQAAMAARRADFVVVFHHREVALAILRRSIEQRVGPGWRRRRVERADRARRGALAEAGIPVLALSGQPEAEALAERMRTAVFADLPEVLRAAA